MKPLGERGVKWLKVCHVLFAVSWLSAAVILTLVLFFVRAADGPQLHRIYQTAKLIDDLVVIPAAAGTCLTGLLFSLKTPWGWFRQRWIAINWAIVAASVVFGIFWLGPRLNALPPIAQQLGMRALADPAYARARTFLLVAAPLQVSALVLALLLCVLKLWKTEHATGGRCSRSSPAAGQARRR